MQKSDALRLVAYLVAAFPRDPIDAETRAVLTSEIALLADASTGLVAVREVCRAVDRLPSIKQIRDAYHATARRVASERAAASGLDAGPAGAIPEWVHVWWWATRGRVPRETRPFPQQRANAAEPPDELTLPEYEGLRSEWELAGKPRLASAAALVGR